MDLGLQGQKYQIGEFLGKYLKNDKISTTFKCHDNICSNLVQK